MEARRKNGEHFLQQVEAVIREKLKENGIEARVERRIKRNWSIYQKLQRQRITVDQVYDFLAIRIIAKEVKDCYGALGAIHNLWRPVAGRIKDFIAMPRPNLYQSLHTTVIAENGTPFEVQIRTEEMHHMCEDGIAAHWKYKDGVPVTAKDEERLAWLRQVVDWQKDVKDPGEFLSGFKLDLYPEEVYTFTPKGKVIILPRDATPVDFAYAIHTEVGERCVGAKVNARMVPLRTKLKSGDIVEIVTNASHHPSRDWLGFVISTRARNKIKHWLNLHQRERAIEIGRKLVEREAKKCARRKRRRRWRHQQRGAARLRLLRRFGGAESSRPRRSAHLPRPLLQSYSRRGDHRLRHSRQGRGGAFAKLPQRAQPDV